MGQNASFIKKNCIIHSIPYIHVHTVSHKEIDARARKDEQGTAAEVAGG